MVFVSNTVNIGNISHVDSVGPDIGQYHVVNIVSGISKSNTILPIYILEPD